jgi:methyltransferase family protein
MLDASLKRIQKQLADDQKLLDVGGWGKPFNRADWVLDLMPYETRGLYGSDGDGPERFTADTWIVRDICDAEPWPFADDEFDFVICSHVLEDVRDPIRVCSELARVAKAGYVEIPSRLEEQSYGFQGPWVGWGHHHWLIDVEGDSIDFVFKHHVLHGRDSDHFPAWFQPTLTAEERVEQVWWDGSFNFRERVIIEPEELDAYLADFVTKELAARSDRAPSTSGRLRRKLGR